MFLASLFFSWRRGQGWAALLVGDDLVAGLSSCWEAMLPFTKGWYESTSFITLFICLLSRLSALTSDSGDCGLAALSMGTIVCWLAATHPRL